MVLNATHSALTTVPLLLLPSHTPLAQANVANGDGECGLSVTE